MSNKNIIILQPKYVADFQCDGSKCNAKCCRNSWRIDIDMETYKKYQRIKNPAMRKHILSSIQPSTVKTGFQIKFNEEGACPLLCEDNLCYIQHNLGEEGLSETCCSYPRRVQNIGEYQIRLLSMTCPVAAEKAVYSKDGMVINQFVGNSVSRAWKLATEAEKVKKSSDALQAINIIMGGLIILQNTAYNFEQRLVLLGLFIDRVEDCQQEVEAVTSLTDYYNSDKIHKEISNLWDNWQYYPAAHKQLMAGIFKVLKREEMLKSIDPWLEMNGNYSKEYEEKHKIVTAKIGDIIERYWQHEWVYHAFPFALQGNLLHNYFAFLIAYEICKLYILSMYDLNVPWDKKKIIELLGKFSKMFDHRKNFLESLVKETEIFESEPLKLMQVLLRLQ